MKFYYNNKLVRTSKTHNYTHAVLRPGGIVYSCHGSKELAEKALRALISAEESSIAFHYRMIEAAKAGKKRIWEKYGNRSYPVTVVDKEEIPEIEKQIECEKAQLLKYQNEWTVVELQTEPKKEEPKAPAFNRFFSNMDEAIAFRKSLNIPYAAIIELKPRCRKNTRANYEYEVKEAEKRGEKIDAAITPICVAWGPRFNTINLMDCAN